MTKSYFYEQSDSLKRQQKTTEDYQFSVVCNRLEDMGVRAIHGWHGLTVREKIGLARAVLSALNAGIDLGQFAVMKPEGELKNFMGDAGIFLSRQRRAAIGQ